MTWTPTEEETYFEMLEVLPPAAWIGDAFLVGEAIDSDAFGAPRFQAFRSRPADATVAPRGTVYEKAAEPMTIQQFRELMRAWA